MLPGQTCSLSVSENALLPPFPKVSDEILKFRLPVLVRVAVLETFNRLIVNAPVFTSSLATVPFKSVT